MCLEEGATHMDPPPECTLSEVIEADPRGASPGSLLGSCCGMGARRDAADGC